LSQFTIIGTYHYIEFVYVAHSKHSNKKIIQTSVHWSENNGYFL